MSRLPLIRSPLSKSTDRGYSVTSTADIKTEDETLFQHPEFEHHEETSNIQLFFDLFFVANLTSFTNAHEINDINTLGAYIGFFCMLWFTWAQVTYYDLRFATDSVFERVAHACHFGAMVGFAIVGPDFLANHNAWGPLQQLSLILMADRLVLLCQYSSTLFFTWRYREARIPLMVIILSLIVAAAIYLGVSFAFYRRTAWHAYSAWYTVAVLEVAVNLFLASRWRPMSFVKTQLVERLSCLTLIILGEGIIGLTRTIVNIERHDLKFTSADIGTIISAVLIIYFIYQLYFDNTRFEPFGSRRQQMWSMLHFPFHLALALMMEGTNQMLLVGHVMRDLTKLLKGFSFDATPQQLSQALKEKSSLIFSRFPPTQEAMEQVQEHIHALAHPAANMTQEEKETDAGVAFLELVRTAVEGFGWEVPETDAQKSGHADFGEEMKQWGDGATEFFSLTFTYFSICTGLVCLLIGVLSLLSQRYHPRPSLVRYISIGANILVGLGIALLSTMTLTSTINDMSETPWTLPGLMLILLALIVLHHLSNVPPKPVDKD